MKFEVYCITNNETNKKYIGITVQGIITRFAKHCYEASQGSNRYLCRAIRKYGVDAFKIEVIDECSNFEELKELEKYYIDKYNTLAPNGYNMTMGGDGALGRPLTEETREKMAAARRGKTPWNKGVKNSQVGHWKGKTMSQEARQKMSIAKKGKKLSEETKEKRKYIYEKMKGENHPLYGVGHSEESKAKMSKSKKGQGTMSYRAFNSDEEHIFNSLSEVKEFLGLKGHSSLQKAIREKSIYKNYYWEKLK